MNRTRLILNALVLLSALAAGGYWAYLKMQRVLDQPVNVAHEVLFEIAPGQTVTKIARELATRGWLTCALCWRLEATHLDLATRIQAGTYAVTATSTPRTTITAIRCCN